jgi:glutamate/tyrosine decarboxylase-like PLP-dependent enzyme
MTKAFFYDDALHKKILTVRLDFSINFSRPGNQVVAQYYNFLRLGMDGYTRIQQACQDVALYLSGEIAKLGQPTPG